MRRFLFVSQRTLFAIRWMLEHLCINLAVRKLRDTSSRAQISQPIAAQSGKNRENWFSAQPYGASHRVFAFPVGTLISERPPDRSERAQFGHSAPTLGV